MLDVYIQLYTYLAGRPQCQKPARQQLCCKLAVSLITPSASSHTSKNLICHHNQVPASSRNDAVRWEALMTQKTVKWDLDLPLRVHPEVLPSILDGGRVPSSVRLIYSNTSLIRTGRAVEICPNYKKSELSVCSR